MWTLLTYLDHDFVDLQNVTVPPSIAFPRDSPPLGRRVFPAQCGRLARQTVSSAC